MYGFTDDKSKWNLGSYSAVRVNYLLFKPGIASEDYNVYHYFPDKYVAAIDVEETELLQVLGESKEPTLIWEVINTENGDLTETQSENAAKIDTVFFQNEKIYIVLNQAPIGGVIDFIFKGA